MHSSCRYPWLVAWLLVSATLEAASHPTIDERLTQLMALKKECSDIPLHSPMECRPAVDYFRSQLQPATRNIRSRTTTELRLLLRAVAEVAVHEPEQRHARTARRIGMELDRRDSLRRSDARMGAGVAMRVRDHRSLNRRGPWGRLLDHHDTPVLPDLQRGRVLWQLLESPSRLVPITIDWSSTQLVISAHPSCGKAHAAREAMMADPRLRDVLRDSNALWLAPPDATIDFSGMHRWNAEHPDQPLHIAQHARAFDGMADGLTPVFYFLRDGIVVARITGWPSMAQAEAVLQAWDRHRSGR